ncbi:MotA/TolQ/ExbB proton channel family protein [Caballeronia mineralivorans]|jgi:biopolymer transport protein ExbB|uniref:MotA/TolQ/ExbB proton channel family protein n=1 Tax=Caballeronia mineralivorans TaxID=2010198 RepID=UPI0023F21D2D|nr:MotA/TolQ/ExbB proton channel family protein [Caballeronia mineralivorans]MDB5786375.1 MotA/TolQ/ExbB proton channel family protein [Caballeronia mineralivorans]MEA3097164.1 biopolymer transport protein ExbB [Caballeronia mineralivorans]
MLRSIIDSSVQSFGLLPLMALIFLAALVIIIERLIFFGTSVRSGRDLEYDLKQVGRARPDEVRKLIQHYEGSVQNELMKSAIELQGQPAEHFEREVEESIMFQMRKLDRNLWVLDTAVTLGPLLGLLGTIIGMIGSFNILGTSGTSDPMAVSGGIAHALIATACGLTIALVGVVSLNYLNKRVRMVLLQMDMIKSMLLSRLAA